MKLTREEFNYMVETLKTAPLSAYTICHIGMSMFLNKDDENMQAKINEASDRLKEEETKKSTIVLAKLYVMESELVEE